MICDDVDGTHSHHKVGYFPALLKACSILSLFTLLNITIHKLHNETVLWTTSVVVNIGNRQCTTTCHHRYYIKYNGMETQYITGSTWSCDDIYR